MNRPGVTGMSRQIVSPDPAPPSEPAANLAVLQSLFAMIGAGRFADLGLFVSEDVECSIYGECAIPMRTFAKGREAMVDLVAHNFALVTHEQAPELGAMVAQGDVVIITGTERGRLAATGDPYAAVFSQEWRFANCKVTSFRQIWAPVAC